MMKHDWESVPLGNFLQRIKDEVLIDDFETYQRLTIHLNNKGIDIRDEIEGSYIGTKRQFVVTAGQFLLSKIDARNGAFGIVPQTVRHGIITGNFWTYNVDETKLSLPYFNYLTHTALFQDFCVRSSSGTTNRRYLREDLFLAREIPLPPLPEQQRIVARIEALARRVQEARGLRGQAVEEVEYLFYNGARQQRLNLVGKYSTKRLGEITTVTSGGTPDRSNSEYWTNGTIPWVKTGELFDKPIWDSEEKITPSAVKNSNARLFPVETVLIALYGQGQTRGRTGILKIPATTNQGSAAILPQPDLFDSAYVQHWLRSLYFEMRAQARDGAQPNWNGGMIKDIEIALPSLSEQRRIAAYLDGLQAKVDELRRLQNQTQQELDALMPSILAKAFGGEL